jgi:hypothetical protein
VKEEAVSKSHGSTTADLRIESPQLESEVLRQRVEAASTHLLGIAEVLHLLSEQGAQTNLRRLLAKGAVDFQIRVQPTDEIWIRARSTQAFAAKPQTIGRLKLWVGDQTQGEDERHEYVIGHPPIG